MKTKEQLCVEFVEEFVKLGFRIDTNPTRMINRSTADGFAAQSEEYAWWSKYVRDAEDRLRVYAKKALEADAS